MECTKTTCVSTRIGTYYLYVALLDTSGKDKAQPLIVCNLFPVQDEYCNGEKKDEEKNKCIRKRVFIASFFCVVFIALEFAGKLKLESVSQTNSENTLRK